MILNNQFLQPILGFVKKSSFSSYLLLFSAFLALLIANSPIYPFFKAVLYQEIGFTIADLRVYKTLLLWINDGLMSIFFFVVGLELKRELIAGELSKPKNVIMPIVAAIGGLLFPAIIYMYFNLNGSSESLNGWGIPMATDIAFALGILYLLGSKVPIQLKVFLTALAIIDDIGAVAVVALFYTSDISSIHLMIGFMLLGVLYGFNRLGVRSVVIYGIVGIGGVWLAFLLSGVHATIAAVLVAFTIPATRRIDKEVYIDKINILKEKLKKAKSTSHQQFLLSFEEENIIGEIKRLSSYSISPLQNLEHSMHSFVLFVVMPVFALVNAGVVLEQDWLEMLLSPVSLGVMFGLLVGKFFGVFGLSYLGLKIGWLKMPAHLNRQMLVGVSFLAAIGFTMSLFINSLAFENEMYQNQAKMGILSASIIAGLLGYFILKNALNKAPNPK